MHGIRFHGNRLKSYVTCVETRMHENRFFPKTPFAKQSKRGNARMALFLKFKKMYQYVDAPRLS